MKLRRIAYPILFIALAAIFLWVYIASFKEVSTPKQAKPAGPNPERNEAIPESVVNELPFKLLAGSSLDGNAVLKMDDGKVKLVKRNQVISEGNFTLVQVSDQRIVVRRNSNYDLFIVSKGSQGGVSEVMKITNLIDAKENDLPIMNR